MSDSKKHKRPTTHRHDRPKLEEDDFLEQFPNHQHHVERADHEPRRLEWYERHQPTH